MLMLLLPLLPPPLPLSWQGLAASSGKKPMSLSIGQTDRLAQAAAETSLADRYRYERTLSRDNNDSLQL